MTGVLDECERPPPRGAGGAGAAATGSLEPALSGGSAEAGAAVTRVLDDGERGPPAGGSAEAGAAATGVIDDGERAPPDGSAVTRGGA